MMGTAALLCVLSLLEAAAASTLDNDGIRTAVDAWLSNPTAAQATYGHISTWETGGVTDMSNLFCGRSDGGSVCNTAAASFNEDIGAWDTSGVTDMNAMFNDAKAFNQDISAWDTSGVTSMYYMFGSGMFGASRFNQDIGDWAVHSVTDMAYIFYYARAFDQDLGWCVDDGVDLHAAFRETRCESTYCGVHCPTTENDKEQNPVALIVCLTVAALLLVVGAFCFYHSRKASMMDKAHQKPQRGPLTPTTAFLESLETRTPAKPETRAAPKAKAAPPWRPGFTRKLSSFLFGEQEEASKRTEPDPAAPKFEEMYNQIAAWYKKPGNAGLRARWGPFPEPEEFQTWPGFVRVTNAFLDATVLDGEAVTSPGNVVVDAEPVSPGISFWGQFH